MLYTVLASLEAAIKGSTSDKDGSKQRCAGGMGRVSRMTDVSGDEGPPSGNCKTPKHAGRWSEGV